MGLFFLVVCLASALAAVVPFQEMNINSEVLADIYSGSTLVRLQRDTSKNASNVTNVTASNVSSLSSAFEEEPETAKLTKHQRLAIILRNLQKNLDNLKALVRKKGGESKRRRNRRRRRYRKDRQESYEEDDDEFTTKSDE